MAALTQSAAARVVIVAFGQKEFVTSGGEAVEPLFSFTVRNIPGGQVVGFRGELDVSSTDAVAELVCGPAGSLMVLDLRELTFVDSSGLGAIHCVRRAMLAAGGVLVLARPQKFVRRVLEVTGLDCWLTEWDPAWSSPSAEARRPDPVFYQTRKAAS
jgi:anti-anti-sigma factor